MKDSNYTFGHCDVYCDGDGCGAEEQVDGFDGHPPQYSDVNQELRSMGWTVKKIDGEWLDFCLNCSE